jgi:hypothetical protein
VVSLSVELIDQSTAKASLITHKHKIAAIAIFTVVRACFIAEASIQTILVLER